MKSIGQRHGDGKEYLGYCLHCLTTSHLLEGARADTVRGFKDSSVAVLEREMICDHLARVVDSPNPGKVDLMWSIGSSPILRPGCRGSFSTGWKGIRCWTIEAVPRLYITTLINN